MKKKPKTTWQVKKNITLIFKIFNKLKKNPKYKDINFNIKKAKRTNTIYITLTTKVNGEIIKRTKRISDHNKIGKKYGGEWITTRRTKKEVTECLEKFIRSIEKARLNKLLDTIP